MSSECKNAMDELRSWMFDNVYKDSAAKKEEYKAKEIISELFGYYMETPPVNGYNPKMSNEPTERIVADYIAGMTDRFALQDYNNKFQQKALSPATIFYK